MTDATLLATIRKELTETWKLLRPFIEHGSTYTHRRDRHDAALLAVDELAKRTEKQSITQESLL